jgi:hypothetical protein
MRTHAIMFLIALLCSVILLTIGYWFGTELSPTLPLFPAACGLLAIIAAVQAGICWERLGQ